MTRYALSRTTNDRYPIEFRPDCERTFSNGYGVDETLVEVRVRLDLNGYDLIDSGEELIRKLEARGLKSENGWQDV